MGRLELGLIVITSDPRRQWRRARTRCPDFPEYIKYLSCARNQLVSRAAQLLGISRQRYMFLLLTVASFLRISCFTYDVILSSVRDFYDEVGKSLLFIAPPPRSLD